jgi:AcrR family transcriptional regulator
LYADYVKEGQQQRSRTLRERTREAVRAEVRREALALFVEWGFDATTTEDIAEAVGISPRSFFRYFPTKEDVLIGESIAFGNNVQEALSERPREEPIWTALRAALQPLVDSTMEDRDRGLSMLRIIMSTTALRAHHFEKHLAWERQLIPLVEQRVGGPKASRALRAQTLTHTALACLDVALAEWVAQEGNPDLGDLLDTSFSHIAAS